jgi:3-hydroxyisobutyrate dehydrogenase
MGNPKIGWVGIGRMGLPMVTRLLQAGHAVTVWNRTRAKAEPLVKLGAVVANDVQELRSVDIVFTMLTAGKDVSQVADGLAGAPAPRILVDCSTIGVDESAELRTRLAGRGVQYLATPVSGNPKCVVAGKLSCIASGPKAAFDAVEPLLRTFALRGVTYAGEAELARICKIAHNMFLAGLFESLIEVTLLAEKHGVPRHAFLGFINNSVLGSIFTQYKSPALANLDFATTLPVGLLKKDVDLGLDAARRLDVAMPVTTTARELVQAHIGAASRRADAAAYLAQDFAALIETAALSSGMTLRPDNVPVPSGLELPEAAE